jgi:hypothetical protein
MTRAHHLPGAFFLAVLAGCPSGGGAPGPNTGSSGTTSGPGPAPSGPLANLNPNEAKPETWQTEGGPVPFLNFEAQRLRISASCQKPSGQMDCEALRVARAGPSVELTPQDRARAAPPGATACVKLRQKLETGRDPKGNEDGFCVFSDGSMIATGSLENYVLK